MNVRVYKPYVSMMQVRNREDLLSLPDARSPLWCICTIPECGAPLPCRGPHTVLAAQLELQCCRQLRHMQTRPAHLQHKASLALFPCRHCAMLDVTLCAGHTKLAQTQVRNNEEQDSVNTRLAGAQQLFICRCCHADIGSRHTADS